MDLRSCARLQSGFGGHATLRTSEGSSFAQSDCIRLGIPQPTVWQRIRKSDQSRVYLCAGMQKIIANVRAYRSRAQAKKVAFAHGSRRDDNDYNY